MEVTSLQKEGNPGHNFPNTLASRRYVTPAHLQNQIKSLTKGSIRLSCGARPKGEAFLTAEIAKIAERIGAHGRAPEPHRRRLGEGKPESFDFLGFTHICSRSPDGIRFTVRRKTVAKRFRAARTDLCGGIE
jgi:hypothetical protein